MAPTKEKIRGVASKTGAFFFVLLSDKREREDEADFLSSQSGNDGLCCILLRLETFK